MAAGRPTKYKPEYCEQAQKLCLLGVTNAELAKYFEVAESTIIKWIAEIDEFSVAVKTGRMYADGNVSKRLYERAMGYSHKSEKLFHYQGEVIRAETTEHYPPDPTSMIFWLKNRRPDLWRDKPAQSEGDEPAPIKVIIETAKGGAQSVADRVSDDTD